MTGAPSPRGPLPLTIQLFVPGVLRNPLNGPLARAHWSKVSQWSNGWKDLVRVTWLEAGQPRLLAAAARVTFTCYVRRLFDDDAIPGCVKPIRDEAVRLVLGTTDGPLSGHEFIYRQQVRRDPDERGVLIEVTPAMTGEGEGR